LLRLPDGALVHRAGTVQPDVHDPLELPAAGLAARLARGRGDADAPASSRRGGGGVPLLLPSPAPRMQSIRSRRPAARSFRFAPHSEEPSGRLRLASGYFLLTGGFAALATLVTLVALLRAPGIEVPRWVLAVGVVTNLL